MAGGSAIDGDMDEFSDLDLVVVAHNKHHTEVLNEAKSFASGLGPLLSAFTGEHVREPRLLLCLYGPPIQRVDLKFIADRDLDHRVEDGRILWQRDSALDAALPRAEALWPSNSPQWMEDRFWTWIHFCAAKIGRGELFAFLDAIAFLRRIVIGPLIRMERGLSPRGVRHIEEIAPELLPRLEATIGDNTRLGCLSALRAIIDLYLQLRESHREVLVRADVESAALSYFIEIESRFRFP
jgi:predicted nucleotidyltransferase